MRLVTRSARTIASLGLAFAAAAIVYAAPPYLNAVSFVVRAAGIAGWQGRLAAWDASPYDESSVEIPIRSGVTPGRLYRPSGRIRRAVVLASGVHPAGIREARLVHLARDLAGTGLAVVTPELPDLTHYRITPESVDILEDAGAWLTHQPALAADGRVGLMGISFSGGLSIVAAGRPAIRDHVAFVFALGGHGDLPRVLRYLCTGREAGGSFRKPHDYGLAVVLLGVAEDMVPADQVDPLRRSIETFLEASALDPVQPEAARPVFSHALALEAALPEPSATLMHEVNTRDVGALGPRLLPHIDAFGGNPALSPERSTPPTAPVFLLHGTDDNVIPADETVRLSAHLGGRTKVHALLSGLITHAEVDRPPNPGEVWRLVLFWKLLFER